MTESITTIESTRLQGLIKKVWDCATEAGSALTAIRDERLYRGTHETFEEFANDVFGYGRRYLDRMVSMEKLKTSPIGLKIKNEGQARAIAKVPEPQRQAVIDAIETEGKPVTAKSIEREAAKISTKFPPLQNNGNVPEPEIRYDSTGYKIPQHRWFLFDRGEEVKALLRKLSDVRCAVRKAHEDHDILYALVSHHFVMSEIDSAYADLEEGVPYAVCPNCQGETYEQCRTCEKRGAISKHLYDNTIASDLKAIREKVYAK